MYLWKKCSLPERIWVIFFIVLFLLLYFFGSITLLTVATAIMGSICMFLGAKAKIANFLPGAVYTILYSWQCYLYNHEISLVLNLFFHFPMQFVGWYLWHTHRVHHPSMQEDILVRQLFPHGGIAVVMGLILVATLFAFVYLTIGIGAYKLDILVVVFYIAAQFLMVGRFVEAWYTWLCVNVFNISLWIHCHHHRPILQLGFYVANLHGQLCVCNLPMDTDWQTPSRTVRRALLPAYKQALLCKLDLNQLSLI